MNTGQLMLVVGAMALLSTGILMMINSFTHSGKVVLKAKLGINAISLASSVIEEATGLGFDAASNDSGIAATTNLTPAAQLGLDMGESYPDSVEVHSLGDRTQYLVSCRSQQRRYGRYARLLCRAPVLVDGDAESERYAPLQGGQSPPGTDNRHRADEI